MIQDSSFTMKNSPRPSSCQTSFRQTAKEGAPSGAPRLRVRRERLRLCLLNCFALVTTFFATLFAFGDFFNHWLWLSKYV